MVCRFMHISEPRLSVRHIENGCSILKIEFDYGPVHQEDGRVPKDEKLDFAECLIRNLNWTKVAEFLKENNINSFVHEYESYSASVVKSNEVDPNWADLVKENDEFYEYMQLRTVTLLISYTQEDDPYKFVAKCIMKSLDGHTLKDAVAKCG